MLQTEIRQLFDRLSGFVAQPGVDRSIRRNRNHRQHGYDLRLFHRLRLPGKHPAEKRDVSEKRHLAHAPHQRRLFQPADIKYTAVVRHLQTCIQHRLAGARFAVALETEQIGVAHRNFDLRCFGIHFRRQFQCETELRLFRNPFLILPDGVGTGARPVVHIRRDRRRHGVVGQCHGNIVGFAGPPEVLAVRPGQIRAGFVQ